MSARSTPVPVGSSPPHVPIPALLLLASLLACGDDGTGPRSDEPEALGVSPLASPLAVGATAQLTATVRDGSGRPMTGIDVAWTSRDTTTATVDADGVVTAVRMGEARVVARAGALSDSVLVDVRHVLASGEGRVRVKGVETFQAALLDGGAVFLDFLGRDDADAFQVVFDNASFTDTVFVALSPGMIPTGVTSLPDWDPAALLQLKSGLDLDQPVAYVLFEEPGGAARYLLASAAPSWMEIQVESAPPGPGMREGLITMHLVAELRRYRVRYAFDDITFEPLPGRDTLYADMRPTFVHWPVGNSDGRVTGGPAPVDWKLRETWWAPSFESLYELEVEDGPPDIHAFTPVASEGAVPVGREASADGSDGPRAMVSMEHWEAPYYDALSDSGILEITRYLAPSGDLFGEVVGTLHADLTGTGSATEGPFPVQLDLEFHAPVFPETSWAAVSSAAPWPGPRDLRWLVPEGGPLLRPWRP